MRRSQLLRLIVYIAILYKKDNILSLGKEFDNRRTSKLVCQMIQSEISVIT